MSNKLVEIPINKWPTLRDLYTKRKDRASSYNLLQTLINWKNKEPELQLSIYSLNGDWEADGTFVAKFLYQVFFNTCGDNPERLLKALNCLDAAKSYTLAGYQDFVVPAVEQHFMDSGLDKEVCKPICTVWYHITREQAKQFTIHAPSNVQLKPLEECHAEHINSFWPFRAPGSIDFVKSLIRQNDSVGLFDNNNLVAWCLIHLLGSLGLLQVMDTHKRKGFGNLIVRYMSKLLAENEIEVTAPVVIDNVASRAMFEKLGFKVIEKVYWADIIANK
ncbi:uncharacterized protein LOC135950512 [Calliphora vicina]|uniref:uncharacterized protein LOC135950512 n=1 Tax=Calliphora vicina TaxID=7373 RepID=UPI00325AA1BB